MTTTSTAETRARGWPRLDTLTIERTSLILLFMLLFTLATRIQVDTDMWWHLRLGEYITETRTVPLVDQFSHTMPGHERRPSEWLAQIIMYGIWQVAHEFGMALFTAALATGGLAILYRSLEGNTYLRGFALVLCAATAAVFWSARPQMFSFFWSTLILYVVYLYKRRGIDRLWWIPPIMLVWAQMHGGWAIGFIILGGTIAGEIVNNLLKARTSIITDKIVTWARGPRLVVFTALGVAMIPISPAGLRLLVLPLETVTIGPLQQYIQEWNAPNFASPSIWPFMFLLALTTLLIVLDWRKLDFTEIIVVGAAAFLSIRAGRNIAFFAVVATPVLTYHLADLMARRGWVLKTVKRPTRMMIRLNVVLIVFIALGCVAKVLLVADPEAVEEAKVQILPVLATDYILENRPPGPMFNSYNFGGYLMFAAPEYPVHTDGRTDLYQDFIYEFIKIWTVSDGWEEALDGINLVLVEPNAPLVERLRADPAWTLAHEDELAVVLTRNP